jgi:hypothetical protein
MPQFLAIGSIFLHTQFFHHLALSETNISHHHRFNYTVFNWHYLYTNFMAEQHGVIERRPVER